MVTYDLELGGRVTRRAAQILPGSDPVRIKTSLDAYHGWLVQNLRGVKGRNDSDVLATIVREWTKDNRAELERLGLWPPEIDSGRAIVVPPGV